MSKNEAFGYRIDRKDYRDKETGDCEGCRFFQAEESTCLLFLCETQSYESCAGWQYKIYEDDSHDEDVPGWFCQIPAAGKVER